MPKNLTPAIIATCVALAVIVVVVVQRRGSEDDLAGSNAGQARSSGASDDSAAGGIRDSGSGGSAGGTDSRDKPSADGKSGGAKVGGERAADDRAKRDAALVQSSRSGQPKSGGGSTVEGSVSGGSSAAIKEALTGAAAQLAQGDQSGASGGTASGGGAVADSDTGDEPLFDGTNHDAIATNGYVEHGDFGEVTSDAGTMSFKIRSDWKEGSQDDATMVELGDGAFRIRKNVNYLRFEYVNDDGQEGGIGYPINEWQEGTEHDIVGTWSGHHMSLYIDGKLVTQGPYEGTITIPDQPKLGIGSSDAHLHPIAPGYVYAPQLLPRPLTSGEVADRVDPNKQNAAK